MISRTLSRHLALSPLLLALAGGGSAALMPAPAQAFGFTGQFAPGAWTLNSYLNATLGDVSTGTPTEALGYNGGSPPNYECSNTPFDAPVNCVSLSNLVQGNAVLVGSDSLNGSNGHGGIGEAWATQWEMTYTDPSTKNFSFKWTYIADDGASSDQAYYYTIDDSNNPIYYQLGSSSGDTSTASVTLSQGWRFGFGVYTASNIGTPGFLSVENFDADPNSVPGPLPALGAAAAFGWSRRLRSRIGRRVARASND